MENGEGNSSAPPAKENVAHVAVRIPPFWDNNPTLWFAQVESQFQLGNVSVDGTKYGHVVANLSERQMLEVQDVIASPPAGNTKYATIKAALIERLSQSKGKQLQQLLHSEELDDRSPSQLLRRMRGLADGSVTDEVLKNIWLARLPEDTRKILTVSTGDLDDLCRVADRLHEIQPAAGQMHALERRIEELTRQLHECSSAPRKSRERVRSNSRSGSHSLSRSRRDNLKNGHGFCWYHECFGSKANKCREPCAFKSENLKGGQ